MSQVIKNIQKEFYHYKALGDRTFEQLDTDQMNWKSSSESSSIGQIVKHMNGNMLSRWTDFLCSDGEKKWRNRDDEFVDTLKTKETILNAWESGWCCLFDAMDTLKEEDLSTEVFIRNMVQTVQAALHRQLAHYAYHVGQIVFIGKTVTNKNWKSLSIPFGKSEEYNQGKFAKPKRTSHFTDD
ncbi:DUF1572 domain-containing protein [Flavobacteriaceae bacterium]|nr:DUF1572 domain-containing protein [Flavobacteriaceae bacterium]